MEKTKRISWVVAMGVWLLFYGCATMQDAELLDSDVRRLQSQLNTIQSQLSTLQKAAQQEEEVRKREIAKEMASYQKKHLEDLAAQQSEIQKMRSDLSLRMENLQAEIRARSTEIEEYKDYVKRPTREIDRVKEDLASRLKILEEKERSLTEKEKIQDNQSRALDERLKAMEERLKALDGKIGNLASRPPGTEKVLPGRDAPDESRGIATGSSDLYRDAYETFQKGNMESARRKFEAFLKQYPNTELSDNAQFWIGETYFLKKDYEKAILEYEKAIVKYPEGDKISAAMLKQGLAFLELGDKANAKNLLRRVVERYPSSEQAEIAKKRLDSIK